MFATKSQIALQLIEQALADQVAPAPVLGDAAYGDSFAFRQRLRELNLEFFLQVTPEEHLGWTQEVPTVLKGKYRKLVDEKLAASARHLLDIARSLPDAVWKDCSWTTGDGKRHHTRIAWQEVITMLSRVIDFFRECGVAVGTMSGRSQQPRPDRFQDLLQRQTRSFFLPQGRWSG